MPFFFMFMLIGNCSIKRLNERGSLFDEVNKMPYFVI